MRQIWRNTNVPKTALLAMLLLGVGMMVMTAGIAFAEEAKPAYGGTLRIAGELDALGFDAIKARSSLGAGRVMGTLVMEKLFERSEKDELIPVLGLSAEPSEDGKVWIVKLREGVKFHDGTPFNADAVVKHWQRLLDPNNRYKMRILFQPIVAVEKTGEFEAKFVLAHAWMPFTAVLTDPSGFTALIPSPKAVEDDVQNRAPVGTGPFIFREWESGDSIVVAKNPDYWQKGKPYLDEIVYRPIPDHESRYAALASGQADIMLTDRPAHVKKLTENPEFTPHILNFRGAVILVMNNAKPPLDDVRVRRAIAHAWDQKTYITASLQDIAPSVDHWFGNAIDCGDVGYPGHDLEKAKSLIAAYGKPVELEYVHTATPRGREAALIVQQMMKEIGVKVNPVPSDFPGIMKKLFGKQYDMSSWLIQGAYDMGPLTTAFLRSDSPWNVTRYANAEVDKLLAEQRMGTDPKARADTLCAIAKKVNSDAPFLYLYGRNYYLFVKNNVKNVTPQVFGEEGIDLTEVWMEKQVGDLAQSFRADKIG
ncbi:ABC transporter substrate-binding protein [Thermodesulfobacteriota bacterium]